MDELGLDFAVLFPTLAAMFLFGRERSELDLAGCRAYNTFVAEQFRPHGDRMTPAAIIPMYDPADALAELDHAASLGLKVALVSAFVWRQIPYVARTAPELASKVKRLDAFGLDSEHDYDPVWAKCVERKLPVMMHGFSLGFTDRSSPTNYVHNHMGHFAAAQEAACRSLFMGGVTRRFPSLRFAFLEGGVGWASRLLNDLVGRFRKRNIVALRETLDPASIDKELARRLCRQYGGSAIAGRADEIADSLEKVMAVDDPAHLDEFASCGLERIEDLQSSFVDKFFFGCEADDPLVTLAFQAKLNPLEARLKALFGSDIGHWDVANLTDPVVESYEMVENGLLNGDDYRAFTCDNAVDLFTGVNPGFFAGTVVDDYARGRRTRP
jgi:hypothetical protein